jgi:hypothetical protein
MRILSTSVEMTIGGNVGNCGGGSEKEEKGN